MQAWWQKAGGWETTLGGWEATLGGWVLLSIARGLQGCKG